MQELNHTVNSIKPKKLTFVIGHRSMLDVSETMYILSVIFLIFINKHINLITVRKVKMSLVETVKKKNLTNSKTK